MADDDSVDCRRASWLLSVAHERSLDEAEAEALRRHLHECLKCRTFEEQLRFIREAARRLGR
jgi:hypothetical protein